MSKLVLDGNNFTSKAGEYIGQAISSNPEYPLKKISFTGISLETIGLTRIVEAVNSNRNVKKLNIGLLTDSGLKQLANLLVANDSPEEISLQETSDH